ncbi:hypothetical protein Rsub_06489 [Raphidocelis subcapitata]|uniref:Pherophorin domain-containing protein n=1 Tax=Raphidocelis subcapitata TaxID=307507 RepID=A0A2V0P3Q9_9CHLO|nr:hypothetical protein Rsub_06489 [Raphidocelis subcapitata]|eukprot:GBF94219.1 hypothetical protein Rsub_06489 [Raphidocelis subcapitata]
MAKRGVLMLVLAALVAAVSGAGHPKRRDASLLDLSVNNDYCVQGADRCCLKGALKTPTLKLLIIYPPSGSTCAQKTTREFVTYNVGGGRFRKIKVEDTYSVLIPLNKLKRAGGEVCVDYAQAGPGCNALDKLCSSSGCRALLWTRKFKRQAGEKKNFCCVSFNGEYTAN